MDCKSKVQAAYKHFHDYLNILLLYYMPMEAQLPWLTFHNVLNDTNAFGFIGGGRWKLACTEIESEGILS